MSGRTLVIETCPPDTPVGCGATNCRWVCLAAELETITDGRLTPGEPVPAGHCPKCRSAAFPILPGNRLAEHAREFAAVAAEIVYGDGTDSSLQHAIDLSNR